MLCIADKKLRLCERTLIKPSPKSTSMASFTMGSKPLWCTPTPRLNIGNAAQICGKRLSSTDKTSMALQKMRSTSSASSGAFKSIVDRWPASSSHWRLLSANTMIYTTQN